MRSAHRIGIAKDQQCRHPDCRQLIRPVIVLPEHLTQLRVQRRPVRRLRSNLRIGLVHRCLLHLRSSRRTHLRHASNDLRIPPVPPKCSRDDHQFPHNIGMLNRHAQRHLAANRVAHHVGLLNLQIPNQRGNIVRHCLKAHRSVDVAGASVSLQIHSDHLAPLRKLRQDRVEHPGRPQAAVYQEQRLPRPVDLVVHLQSVHRRIAALPGRLVRLSACHHRHHQNDLRDRNCKKPHLPCHDSPSA